MSEAEIERQIEVLEKGGTIEQETRGYDVELGKTFRLRGKETAHDYRYMPEPDLPSLILTEVRIKKNQKNGYLGLGATSYHEFSSNLIAGVYRFFA
jgi:Asp-tRNA(Asn)/Glu-tRNA(Gln) amidotransferase B subunit